MKKNLLFLFTFILTAGLTFISCSDDNGGGEEPPPPPVETKWEDFVATYNNTENLTITNESVLARNSERSVVIAKSESEDKARLTIKNLIPESKDIVIDGVEIKKVTEDRFTFEASQPVGESSVTITGTLTKSEDSKSMNITYTRKVNSDVVGSWNSEASLFNAFASAENFTANIAVKAAVAIMNPMINNMINEKVDDVTIEFSENGEFTFNWTTVEGVTLNLADMLSSVVPIELLPVIQGALRFEYYTEDDVLYVAVNKTIIDLLGSLPEGLIPIDLEPILGLLELNGGYYTIGLNKRMTDDSAVFYVEKDFITEVLPLILDLVGGDNELISSLMPTINTIINRADVFEIQLKFTKGE